MNKLLKRALESAAKSGHSLFSPSGSAKYMLCPGAVWMEREYESTSNPAADLGSDKHELSEICIKKRTDPANYLGRLMTCGNEVDEDFITHVRYYVDFVSRLVNDSEFHAVEMFVDLSELKQLPDEGGMADFVALRQDRLFVVDAKFGYIKVAAEDNTQLLEYGIGVYDELDRMGLVDDVTHVSLIIVQPQHDLIDDWVIDVQTLLAHKEKVRTAVEQACLPFAGGEPVLNPGKKQCQWCKALADCPAAANAVFEAVTNTTLPDDAFDDLDAVKEPVERGIKHADQYNAKKLATCYAMIDLVQDWCKAVSTRVHEKLTRGEEVPGYKLVAGRKGNRKFTDEDAVEAALRAARIKVDDMYNRKLISPAQAVTLLKGKPKVLAKIEPLIVQADGKPVVAPMSDSKPALVSTTDQFDDLNDDNLV